MSSPSFGESIRSFRRPDAHAKNVSSCSISNGPRSARAATRGTSPATLSTRALTSTFRGTLRVADLDHVPVRVGEVRERHARRVLAAAEEPPARLLHLTHLRVEVRVAEREAEVRDAAADRLRLRHLAERDEVTAARRAEEDHPPAFPEPDLEPERLLVERERALDVGDVQVQVVETTRRDHDVPARPRASTARARAQR